MVARPIESKRIAKKRSAKVWVARPFLTNAIAELKGCHARSLRTLFAGQRPPWSLTDRVLFPCRSAATPRGSLGSDTCFAGSRQTPPLDFTHWLASTFFLERIVG